MNYLISFKKSLELYSNKTAIVDLDGTRHTSYSELDNLSDKVAGKLHSIGCAKGSFITILIDRRMEYIAAYLGILKTGCVVVPLTFEYPKARIDTITKHCDAKLTIDIEFFEDIEKYDAFQDLAQDNDPALLLFTSGSTGVPKGVLHTVSSLTNSIKRHIHYYDSVESLILAATASFTFALSVVEYFPNFICGGCVHIISDTTKHSPILLEKYYEKYRITCATVPPSFLPLIHLPPCIQRIYCSGETLYDVQIKGNYSIYFNYGLTEGCGVVIANILTKSCIHPTLGYPLPGIQILIADKEGNKVAQGIGEICVIGDFNASYFKLPQETANKFIKTSDGKTLYHTGDMGCVDENGEIVYLNRMDWMVKINGHRVEIVEVELALSSYPKIKNVVVKAFSDDKNEAYLVGYYVCEDNLDVYEIRRHLKKTLPDFMIPRYFVSLPSMPMNINGKFDRNSLISPEFDMVNTVDGNKYTPPKNELQKKIYDILTKIIGHAGFGIHTNMINSGLSSIGIARLIVQLSQEFDIPIQTKDIAENPTIELLEKFILSYEEEVGYDIFSDYSLSKSQEGIYVESLLHVGTCIYNTPILFKVDSSIDGNRLKSAIVSAVKVHPYIDTRLFTNADCEVRQKRTEVTFSEIDIEVINVSSIEDIKQSLVQPFNLIGERLFRIKLIQADGLYLFIDMHHIIFDGTSENIFFKAIEQAYDGATLIPEIYSGYEYALQNKIDRERYGEDAKKYFTELINGFDTDMLPKSDLYEPGLETYGSVLKTFDGFTAIQQYCLKNNITPNGYFTAAFGYLLAEFNGIDYSVFAAIHNGRFDSRFADTIAMMVQTIPVVCSFEETVKIYVTKVSKQLFASQMHSSYSFAEMRHDFGVTSDILFVYEGDEFNADSFCGQPIEVIQLSHNQQKAPLSIIVNIFQNTISVSIEYDASRFSRDLVLSMLSSYQKVLFDFIQKEKLSEVSLVDEKMLAELDALNETDVPYDRSKTIVDIFREQVALRPDAIAVVYLDKKYTYREVDDISERIAQYVAELGIGKDDFVAILIPRCEYMPIAALGVLKAGAAYQPLDPAYPAERLNFMIKDSGAKLLICDRSLRELISEYNGDTLYLDAISTLPLNEIALKSPSVENAFVILYTSGTTGIPKGCVVEHRNIDAFIQWYIQYGKLSELTQHCAYASFGFDAHLLEVFPTLCAGGQVHILSESVRLDLSKIDKYFINNKITNALIPSQVGRLFTSITKCTTLKQVLLGGEALKSINPRNEFEIINAYGPTEATVCTTTEQITKENSDRIPIGKPCQNTKLYILDKYMNRVPIGAVGELYISGAHVTRGYLNRPEETSKAFLNNPFSEDSNYTRLYKTGDLVRLLPDGNYDFIGRRDKQVKIRGNRVELKEVEHIILEFKGINEATTVAFDYASGGKYLAAYIVSDKTIDIDALKAFIRSSKPSYMVPSVIMQIEKIPLNQNGKVNKSALPVPEIQIYSEIVAPKNKMQKKLHEIISGVIGTSNFGITNDIFDAGLNSIDSIKLNLLLAKEFNVPFQMKDIKENPTIEKLEVFLNSDIKSFSYPVLIDYPLSDSQNWILNVCIEDGNLDCLVNRHLLKLSKNIDIEKLKQAIIDAINAHPYFKTKLYTSEAGELRQKRFDDEILTVNDIEVLSIPSLNCLDPEYFKIMTSNRDRLFRFILIETSQDNELYFLYQVHHIVTDGISNGLFLTDVTSAYCGEKLIREKYSYYEYILLEQDKKKTVLFTKAKHYFDSSFATIANEVMVHDPYQNYENANANEVVISYNISSKTVFANVEQFCELKNISMNGFFNAVFGYVVSNICNINRFSFCSVYGNRGEAPFENSVGCFAHLIPVSCSFETDSVLTYLKTVSNQINKSMNYMSYGRFIPFSELMPEIGNNYALFAYYGNMFELTNFCGEPAVSIQVNNPLQNNQQIPKSTPMFCNVINYAGKIMCNLIGAPKSRYSKKFFDTVARLMITCSIEFIHKEKLSDVDLGI